MIPSLPDPTRTDVTAPMFSTWRVGTPARQRATLDAIAAVWTSRPWPSPDLRAYSVFPGADGSTLLHFSQWADAAAYDAFVAAHRQGRSDEIDAAVPGIERVALHRYRLHRSLAETGGPAALFVVVTREFDGPDAARAWADEELDRARPRGLVVAHAHLGVDGRRALILQDWTDPDARWQIGDRPGATSSRFGLPLHLTP